MIRYSDGDIFACGAEALVNPVNCEGVMGAGLAKEFRHRFPEASRSYMAACAIGQLQPGRLHEFDRGSGSHPRWVIHFPTKREWRKPSRPEWIGWGLSHLAPTIERLGINSIGVPALGCGKGGLPWLLVAAEIFRYLNPLAAEVIVFRPPQERSPWERSPSRTETRSTRKRS